MPRRTPLETVPPDAPLTQDEADRLWAELWAGYQELLAEERTAACDSKDSE